MGFWSRLASFVSGRSGWRQLFTPPADLVEGAVPVSTVLAPVQAADIDFIRLSNPSSRVQVNFKKARASDLDSFVPILLAPASLGGWNQLVASLGRTGLSPGSFSGVFVATAPISDLMQLSSGGYGSAVIGAGGIERQTGFIPISAAAFAPLVAFEVLSLVTGQYFLHQISARLQTIEDMLSELSRLLHSEKIGELRQAEGRIRSLLQNRTVAPEDLLEIRALSNQVGAIAAQYHSVLGGMTERVRHVTESAARGITTTMGAALARSLSNRRDLLCMRIAIKATELQLVSRLAQLSLAIRRSEQDASRLNEIIELRESLGTEIVAFEERMRLLTQEITAFFAYFQTEGGKLKTWIPFDGKRAEKILAYVQAESETIERLLSEAASTLTSVKERNAEIDLLLLPDRPVTVVLQLESGQVHSIKIGKAAERVAVGSREEARETVRQAFGYPDSGRRNV